MTISWNQIFDTKVTIFDTKIAFYTKMTVFNAKLAVSIGKLLFWHEIGHFRYENDFSDTMTVS